MDRREDIVRVRFAPSPTGFLHIGGLRTALYNYLFARKNDGVFILRVEDTDRERFVPDAEADILESLRWAGMDFDEGPGKGGAHGPYYQSHRKALYKGYVDTLVADGHAYYAFDTREELEAMRSRLTTAENPAPRYDMVSRKTMRNSFTLEESEVNRLIDMGTPYVIRLRVPENEHVQFEDLVRGNVNFASAEVDDQILLKSDGMPTYHLANVVDDHLMGITHIIRGEEWLPSTPKHMLLYKAFGWTPPMTAHLPLILSPTGGKLSKRNAEKMGIPVSVQQYRDAGYEPEAVVNFLAMLGWNPGTEQEIFSQRELIEAFSPERVGSSGVQFNLDKLKWYNEQYLHSFSAAELKERAQPILEDAGIRVSTETLDAILALMRERLSFAKDIVSEAGYFFEDPQDYDEKGVKKRWKEDTSALLTSFIARLEALDPFSALLIEDALKTFVEAQEIGFGKIMAPLRLALTGVMGGPDLYGTMEVLGKDVCLRRLRRAISVLG